MISRRSTKLLADAYATTFSRVVQTGYSQGYGASTAHRVSQQKLYDFLYERDHDSWLCNVMKKQRDRSDLRDFVMKLHTTESLKTSGDWTTEQRATWCQSTLRKLSEDLIADPAHDEAVAPLVKSLELDGYVFSVGKLRLSEGETRDVEQERGELLQLYVSLGLPNEAVVRDCLEKSEQHFTSNPPSYRDCISNARHFLEKVTHDVAEAWSVRPGEPPLVIPDKQPAAGPSRNYLRDRAVLTADECNAFKELHGLLSVSGGHPALPEQEQARVFRRLALSMALFVLLAYNAKR